MQGWKQKDKPGRLRCAARRVRKRVEGAAERLRSATQGLCARTYAKLSDTGGQGTTEYAILVGILVVIAIIAITVFRPKLEELWNAIADGINSL